MPTLFALLLVGMLAGSSGPVESTPAVASSAALFPEAAHDFHVSYGQMAVEKNVAVCRIRFFKNDLEEALQQYYQQPDIRLDISPRIDSLFTSYFNDKFKLKVASEPLEGVIVGSGEDRMGREEMWWYSMQFEAPETLQTFTVTNTLLFERFNDQKNIFKVRHFPDEEQKLYYFAEGAEEYTVSF